MVPDLASVFALRLAVGRKLMLVAMIHEADGRGWYEGNASALARMIQMNVPNANESLRQLEIRGLIRPHPNNRANAPLRRWRIDPKLVIGNQNDQIIALGNAGDRQPDQRQPGAGHEIHRH